MSSTTPSPPSCDGGWTVADLAARWRVSEDKIRAWIRAGELIGINVARTLCGRPQWRITADAVAAFERRRCAATPRQGRRQGRRTDQIDYYPDDGGGVATGQMQGNSADKTGS